MVKKRVDDRGNAVEEGARSEQRSLIVLVGDHGKDQVVNLHQMLARARRRQTEMLWCYKKELGFSVIGKTHEAGKNKSLEVARRFYG